MPPKRKAAKGVVYSEPPDSLDDIFFEEEEESPVRKPRQKKKEDKETKETKETSSKKEAAEAKDKKGDKRAEAGKKADAGKKPAAETGKKADSKQKKEQAAPSTIKLKQCERCGRHKAVPARMGGDELLEEEDEDEEQPWICDRCSVEPLGKKVEAVLDWRYLEEKVEEGGDGDAVSLAVALADADKHKRKNKVQSREMFVKWKGESYIHCQWIREAQLANEQPALLRNFLKKIEGTEDGVRDAAGEDDGSEVADPSEYRNGVKVAWTRAERVIAQKKTPEGMKYLVKWYELGYEQATWETAADISEFKDKIDQFLKREFEEEEEVVLEDRMKVGQSTSGQPAFLQRDGLVLHEYQLEGLNWLRFSWAHRTNTILADEMGLGKTIQSITFVRSLFEDKVMTGPVLVCVPLSTLRNWEREFSIWAPKLYLVSYTGSAEGRRIIRDYEFYHQRDQPAAPSTAFGAKRLRKVKSSDSLKFDVLLTSYEMIIGDYTTLGSIGWKVLVVDEAHRLKNNESKFFKQLSGYPADYRLLLTGTPLQNNLEELFHLLNFLSKDRFSSLEKFQDTFSDLSKEEQISQLHTLLGPHLLRRMKADVLKHMPAKSEFIVCVDLSPVQKQYYRHILTRNFDALNKSQTQGGRSGSVSLLNIMAELKKVCNHPFLFETARDEADRNVNPSNDPDVPQSFGWRLIQASGKLMLLDKMLTRLKASGHRVLIFSQMTRLLDLLEEYLHLRGYLYERIDGSVTGADRQERIDSFNAPDAKQFCFLLSTRAGGLGINLATADTVIIYDSDWNPHNDVQAFSRAHRLGQQNKVMIYRFVTRGSVEERIIELAKRKMMLTHLVVRSGMGSQNAQTSLSKQELDGILRFGTSGLFAEADASADAAGVNSDGVYTMPSMEGGGIVYDDKAIDNLLDRTQEGLVHKEEVANEYLSSFKVATFTTTNEAGEEDEEAAEDDEAVEVKSKDEEEEADGNYWERLLHAHHEREQERQAESMGKGKRSRKLVDYYSGGLEHMYESDSDEVLPEELSDYSDESGEDDQYEEKAKGPRGRAKREYQKPPLLSNRKGKLEVLGFTSRQRQSFVRTVMKYGLGDDWLDVFARTHHLRRKRREEIFDYGRLLMQHLCEPDSNAETFLDGVPKEDIARQHLLDRIGTIALVHAKIEQCKIIAAENAVPLTYEQPAEGAAADDSKDIVVPGLTLDCLRALSEYFHIADGGFTQVTLNWLDAEDLGWGKGEDFMLLYGLTKYGYGEWQDMINDVTLALKQPALRAIVLEKKQAEMEQQQSERVERLDTDVSMLDVSKDELEAEDEDGPAPTPQPSRPTSAAPAHRRGRRDQEQLPAAASADLRDVEMKDVGAAAGAAAAAASAAVVEKGKDDGESSTALCRFLLRRCLMLTRALIVEEQLVRGMELPDMDRNAPELNLYNAVEELAVEVDSVKDLYIAAAEGGVVAAKFRKTMRKIDHLLGEAKVEFTRMKKDMQEQAPVTDMLGITEKGILAAATTKLRSAAVAQPAQRTLSQTPTNA